MRTGLCGRTFDLLIERVLDWLPQRWHLNILIASPLAPLSQRWIWEIEMPLRWCTGIDHWVTGKRWEQRGEMIWCCCCCCSFYWRPIQVESHSSYEIWVSSAKTFIAIRSTQKFLFVCLFSVWKKTNKQTNNLLIIIGIIGTYSHNVTPVHWFS